METLEVPAAEVQQDFGRYQDLALAQPVTITRDGRERTVLVSAQEYARLKRRDRKVMSLADFTSEDIEALENARPSEEAAAFDHEVEA